jgi:hypothetical protein
MLAGTTDERLAHDQTLEPQLGVPTAGLVKFGRIEIPEPHFDPLIWATCWADAQTISVPDIPNDP